MENIGLLEISEYGCSFFLSEQIIYEIWKAHRRRKQ